MLQEGTHHPIHTGWVLNGELHPVPPSEIEAYPYDPDGECCPYDSGARIHDDAKAGKPATVTAPRPTAEAQRAAEERTQPQAPW